MAYTKKNYYEDNFVMNHYNRVSEDYQKISSSDPPSDGDPPEAVPFSYATKGVRIRTNPDAYKTNLG